MPTQVSLLDGALASAGTLAIQTNGTTSAITISSAQVATFVNNPIMTGLTASRAVFTDGSKGLTSNAITGTGNVVMSASPTLTGTIDGAALTLSSSLTLSGGTANGVLYLNGSKVATSGSVLTFDGAQLGVNGITVGRGAGAVSTNTAVGVNALAANTTGDLNTVVGYDALDANTSGAYNNAFGRGALGSNTTGNNNTAIGTENPSIYGPLFFNTTGSQNTALGNGALANNTTASNNTAVGYQSLYSNTTGANNTAVGFYAGYANTTGYANTFLGRTAGEGNTTGYQNTFVGNNSGNAITTGNNNTILGRYTGNQGGLDIRTASNRIVLSDGDGNPRGIFDNSGNFLVGTTSLLTGSPRLNVSSTGSYTATFNQTDNTDRVAIRIQNTYAQSSQNATMIQFVDSGGNERGTIKTTGTATSYNTSSDYRLKENIQPMTGALDKVAQLNPVTYNWKADGSAGQGFIAHELQAVVPDCVTGEKDAVDADGNPAYQGIDTSFLVATLTAAIKELKSELDSVKAELATLKGA